MIVQAKDFLNDVVVKDFNGTVVNNGDTVTVIKVLKVQGGSSD